MRSEEVKTYVVGNLPPHRGGRHWVFLRPRTDEGLVGYREAFAVPFSPHTRLIEDVAERLVLGADPFRTGLLWRTLFSSGYAQHPDLTTMGVVSAIERACWDIVGTALNQPIYNLPGGQFHERLRSSTYRYAGREPGAAREPKRVSPSAGVELGHESQSSDCDSCLRLANGRGWSGSRFERIGAAWP
jgi:2-dehydro-3-deoxyphosphogalactonate aldolase